MGVVAVQGRGRRVRVRHSRGPPALGDPAADPSSARRPRGHRAGHRVAGVRRAGSHGPGQRGTGPGHIRPRHRPAARPRHRPAGASGPTPSTSASTIPPCPVRPTCCGSALRELAASGDLEALLRYQPHRGRPQDRATVARHLRLARAAGQRRAGPDRQRLPARAGHDGHGDAAAGDVVAVDALTYPGFKVLAHTLRLELAPLPATPDGPDLDALERLCADRPVRAVYAMPTLHNPLGWVMDASARERLAEIARRQRLLIIEDASYAYLAGDAPPPIAALAPEVTVYVSGLSKSVATGLRVGFVSAPAALVPAIERAIRVTTWNTPAITTAIACRWLDDGTVGRLEADKRDDARARQSIARDALAGPAPDRPPVFLLPVAAAGAGRPGRPDSGGARAQGASLSPPPSRTRPPRRHRRRFDWPWAPPTSTACVRRWARCGRPSRPTPSGKRPHPPRPAEGYLQSHRKHLRDGAIHHRDRDWPDRLTARLPPDRGARHRRRSAHGRPHRHRRHRRLVLPGPFRRPEPVRRAAGQGQGRLLLPHRQDQLRQAEAALPARHQHPAHQVPGQGGGRRGHRLHGPGDEVHRQGARPAGQAGPRGQGHGQVRARLPSGVRLRPGWATRSQIIQGVGAVFTSPLGRAVLRTNVGLKAEENGVAATFTLEEGETADFHLEWNGDVRPIADGETRRGCSRKTQDFWRSWVGQSRYTGRWREMVQRSALALKLLVYHPTGALVAAPTTSLPEEPGGTRNWDYRYAWLRDASFTVYSLMRLGFLEEAASFMDWLQKRCETATAERDVIDHVHRRRPRSHPRGDARPPRRATTARGRSGSATARSGQRQLDVYGEIMDSVYLYNKEVPISWDLWTGLSKRLDWLSKHWTEPDEGIWEIRGPRQRFTYSALMTWVAYDRAGRLARDRGLPAPVERWRKLAAQAYRFVQEQCWDPEPADLRHVPGQPAARRLLLVMPLVKFAGPTDPRFLATLDKISGELVSDSLVNRYALTGARRHRRRRGHLQPLLVLVRRGADPGRPRPRGQEGVREDAHLRQPPGAVRRADRPLGRGARQLPPGLHPPGPDQRRRQPGQGPRPPDGLAKTIKTSRTARDNLPICQAPSRSSGRRPCPGSPNTPTPPPRPPGPG